MDYLKIVKRAFEISIKNKILWIFGIFAGGLGGFRAGGNVLNYSDSSSDFPKTLGTWTGASNFDQFWSIWGGFVLTIIGIILVFCLIIFILNLISQGALIAEVSSISESGKANFSRGLRSGAKQFFRVLAVLLAFLGMFLVSLIVWLGPVAVAITTQVMPFAVIWGILLFFVVMAFWILMSLIGPYALRVVVLEKKGIIESIKESLHLFRDNWVHIVITYLLLLAISIGYGILLMLLVFLIGALIVAIGYGIYLVTAGAAIVFGIIIGIGFLAALVAVSGAFNTFYSSVFTLVYLELKKK